MTHPRKPKPHRPGKDQAPTPSQPTFPSLLRGAPRPSRPIPQFIQKIGSTIRDDYRYTLSKFDERTNLQAQRVEQEAANVAKGAHVITQKINGTIQRRAPLGRKKVGDMFKNAVDGPGGAKKTLRQLLTGEP